MPSTSASRKSERTKGKDEKDDVQGEEIKEKDAYALPTPLQVAERTAAGTSTPMKSAHDPETALDEELEELEKSIRDTEGQLREIE